MKWIHIDFWFWDCTYRTDAYLTEKKKKQFERLLAKFITKCRPYIKRKFYLYEDIPHCFLALETEKKYIPLIQKYIPLLKADFIYKAYYNSKAGGDKGNGEGFLNILDAFTEFFLFKKDNCITHIVHCCMEFIHPSRQAECEFYQNMAILYQVVKIKNRKVTYGLKKIRKPLRKKLIKYIKSLDLRRRK